MSTPRRMIAFGFALGFAASISVPLCGMEPDLPQALRAYYERDGYAGEDGSMTEWEGRGKQFVAFFAVNWKGLLQSWESSPPTPQQAALVRSASEALPGREYLEFLNVFLDHYDKGRININVTMNAMAGMGDKMGFIATNFQDLDVRKLVNRYRGLMSADPNQTRWCDSILKGDLRFQHQMFRGKSHPAPELLSPTQKSSQKTANGPNADTHPNPNPKASETKPSVPSEEPTSSAPWSIIVVVIVAAIGLLWLLLKNRRQLS